MLLAVTLNLSGTEQLIIFGIENLAWTDNYREQERSNFSALTEKLSTTDVFNLFEITLSRRWSDIHVPGKIMFRQEKLLP